MEKIAKFIECLVPISNCNLRCSYCYVIQQNRRDSNVNPFKCSPEDIGKAFNKDRWGGTMLINLCGFGETLAPKEMPEIILAILKEGHYINVTNNGTMSRRFDEIVTFPKEYLERLCFAFSLHYVELKRRNMLQTFVANVNKVKECGCSILIQLNLADEYIECLDEIKEFCISNFGALPQVALTRKEGNDYEIFTKYSDEEYIDIGKSFNSPLFDFTCKNFRIKRNEFCYAGKWSFKLDLASGDLRSCYFSSPHYNIYDNPNEKIREQTIGNNCDNSYCVNSSHFMSLGIIPDIRCASYVELRDRGNWYTPTMKEFLSQKLYEHNKELSKCGKIRANIAYRINTGSYKKYFRIKSYRDYLSRKLRCK